MSYVISSAEAVVSSTPTNTSVENPWCHVSQQKLNKVAPWGSRMLLAGQVLNLCHFFANMLRSNIYTLIFVSFAFLLFISPLHFLPSSTMSPVAKNRVASLARDLIRIESITPVDGGCQDIVRRHLEKIGGFKCETLKYHDVTNLWAYRGNLDINPLVVFAGHSDVVPPGPLEDWKHHPFEGTIDDHNVLHGRGAVDMKGGIASFIVALEDFLTNHPDHTYSIGIIITSDEEGNAGKLRT